METLYIAYNTRVNIVSSQASKPLKKPHEPYNTREGKPSRNPARNPYR